MSKSDDFKLFFEFARSAFYQLVNPFPHVLGETDTLFEGNIRRFLGHMSFDSDTIQRLFSICSSWVALRNRGRHGFCIRR